VFNDFLLNSVVIKTLKGNIFTVLPYQIKKFVFWLLKKHQMP